MTARDQDPDGAVVVFDPDEAVVLLDLLHRWEHDRDKPYPADECFESPAEIRALLDLLCRLEKQLVAPFKSDYAEILQAARTRLSDGYEDMTLRG